MLLIRQAAVYAPEYLGVSSCQYYFSFIFIFTNNLICIIFIQQIQFICRVKFIKYYH